jgi:hypothetical protein
MLKRLLNHEQVRWAELLFRFKYNIRYPQGQSNQKVDAFARHPGDFAKRSDERLKTIEHMVLEAESLLEK